ncbi:MAG: UxaA family hydrolase [Clostridia bacterium]|nr:UxaA family hydrolase [Clostridia bacterium]
MRTYLGYCRSDGSVGIRNHVLVLPTVVCANAVVEEVARRVPQAAPITHPYGCTLDPVANEEMTSILAATAGNPNVFGTVIVALGCETVVAEKVRQRAVAHGRRVELVVIQDEGDTEAAADKASAIARRMVEMSADERRVECGPESLVVGLECGASDAFSGLSANPAVGRASDQLVDMGATVILSEITEFMGAEQIAAAQAADEKVRRDVLDVVARTERELAAIGPGYGFSDITPGNMEGGLTTIEEKSLGCIRKGGSRPIMQVVGYGERPGRHGLIIMDTPGQDIESLTGMMAGGAQMALFTTGRGTPTGSPAAPVIKVVSNTPTFEKMRKNLDINAGGIVDGTRSLDAVAGDIVDFIFEVAGGRLTASEAHGHREFGLRRRGATGCIY